MKAISLHQPWASLVVSGHKRHETRTWQTSYRGWLLIHAAKARLPERVALCSVEPFRTALAGIPFLDLPFGALLGAVRLTACHPADTIRDQIPTDEQAFGNYAAGRWAWELADAVALPRPIPWRGEQGLFAVDDCHLPAGWLRGDY